MQGDPQGATGAPYLPEAAKGIRADASFSGSRADVTNSSPAAAQQPSSSHMSAASRRTADEMLTALRKVPRTIITHSMLMLPLHFVSRIMHKHCDRMACRSRAVALYLLDSFELTIFSIHPGHGSFEARSPGQAKNALLQAGRGRLSADVAICKRQTTQHSTGFCKAGDLDRS